MTDDRDPLLTRLFAEQSRPAPASDFTVRFVSRFERDRRIRRAYRTGGMVAGAIVTMLLAPWIAQIAATALGSVVAGIIATREILNFPMAWLVVCSTVGSLLPVIYLGMTRRW